MGHTEEVMTAWRREPRTLVDLTERALRNDPRDAPVVQLEADVFADDLARYTPTAPEPAQGHTL